MSRRVSTWAFFFGYILGIIIYLVYFSSFAKASTDTTAFTKLKATTLHIMIGTGFVLEAPSSNDYLISNWHVCNAGNWKGSIYGNFPDGRLVEGKVVKSDPMSDLCAVKIAKQPSVLKMSKGLSRGQTVYTRGYPYGILSESKGRFIGVDTWEFMYPIEDVGKCFKGSRERYNEQGHLAGCLVKYTDNMVDLYARPGSSGSPVVDIDGNLVGVISSWNGETDVGGMVPFKQVEEFIIGL